MTGIEIIVVLFGGFLGYWIVSKFITENPKTNPDESSGRNEQRAAEQEFNRQDQDPAALQTWHQVLDVSSDAPIDEIRRAYKGLMSKYHPDKVATLGDELKVLAEKKSKQITAAYKEALELRGGDS